MPTGNDITKARCEAGESPTVWFAILERARLVNDFNLAASARTKLRELGVTVRYHQKQPTEPCRCSGGRA